jgi:shikimate kinase
VQAQRPICLVGMPGSGKSTVGRQLAKRLGRHFSDTDALIERRIDGSIRAFFETAGEAAFRDIETEVIDGFLATNPNDVIATGGGAILREGNRRLLAEHAHVVYLRTSSEELFRRLRNDTQRPLLQVKDPQARLRELFAERDPLYAEVAHFVVETGRPSVQSLVNMVLMQLELAGIVDPKPMPDPAEPQRPRD